MESIIVNKKLTMIKKVFLFNLCCIAAAYSGLLHNHFATDSYQNIIVSNAGWQLNVGRYSIYILEVIFEKLGISLFKYQIFFMLITILLLTVCSCLIFLMTQNKLDTYKQSFIKNIAILLCVINVFSIELYLFPEYVIYNGLGITFAVLAAFIIYEKISIKRILFSALCLLISLGFYQANIGVFLIVSLGSAWVQKKVLINNEIAIFIGLIVSLINIFIKKILVKIGLAEVISRDSQLNIHTLINNLKVIINGQGQGQKDIIFNGANLLPKGVLLVVLISLVLIIMVNMILNHNQIKFIIHTVLLLILGYIVVYAPHLIAGSVWLSPRTIYTLFFYLGFLGIMAIQVSPREKHFIINLVGGILIIFLAINFWSMQGIVVNHFATNKIDQNYAHDIYKEIEKYENETGNTISNIATVTDDIPLYKNHYVDYYSFNINERAFINDWSDVSVICWVSGRIFNKVPMDEKIYDKYFKNKDWDYFSPEEQLYFQGDTLYWCKY